MENCYVTGTVTGGSYTGGVVGYSSGNVKNCYVTGTVTGSSDNTGGVVGYNAGTVESCYAAGSVVGKQHVGGVLGQNSTSGTMTNCVALNASVTGTTNVGRVIGSGGTVTNNYAWSGMTVNGDSYSAAIGADKKDGADLSAADAKTETYWTTSSNWNTTTGSAWDFTDVWKWTADKMPHLNANDAQDWPGYLVDDPNLGMDGSAENPFKVYNVATLRKIGTGDWGLDKHYEQIADIVFVEADKIYDDGKSNHVAIGTYSSAPFIGTYDGDGHTITGLVINTTSGYQGLFGYTGTSTIKNLGLKMVDIKAGSNVGGVAGSNEGTIKNCYVTGSITGVSVGGGVAGGNSGTVTNCVALNESVTITANTITVGRVVSGGSGTRANNHAWSGMKLCYDTDKEVATDSADIGFDGKDIDNDETLNGLWGTLGFTGDMWTGHTFPTLPTAAGARMMVAFDLAFVAVDASEGGAVTLAGAEGGVAFLGDWVTATATPDDGYRFVEWQDLDGETVGCDDLGVPQNPYSFEVTGDVTLIAVFTTEDEAVPVDAAFDLPTAEPRKEPEEEEPEPNDDESPDSDGDDGDDDAGEANETELTPLEKAMQDYEDSMEVLRSMID